MAIEYKLKNTNITNEQGSILYIEDTTENYGSPNQDRSGIALFLQGYYKGSKSDIKISIVPYNPLTVDKFSANIPQDGWYTFVLSSFQILSQVTNLQSYQIYYDDNTGQLVKLIVQGGIEVARVVVNLDDIEITDYQVAMVDAFIIYNNSKVKVRLNSQISDLLTNNIDFKDKNLVRLKDNYDALRAILQGAVYEYCRGNKAVAQKSIEFLNTNNYVSE